MNDDERAIYNEIENAQNACSSWELGDLTSHQVAEQLEKAAGALRALPCDNVITPPEPDNLGEPDDHPSNRP